MFHGIPAPFLARMNELEAIDAADRRDGTPPLRRLRQIPRDTGRLLAILAAGIGTGNILEIGTSAGYSTLWLALGARRAGASITTYEILPDKIRLATETIEVCGLADTVKLVQGDARDYLKGAMPIALCFLDSEKDTYAEFYDLVVPRLVPGGLLVADNIISHQGDLKAFLDRALTDRRVDAVTVPLDRGLLICRKA